MSDDEDNAGADAEVGYETVMPTTPFEGRKYRITFQCDKCGHKYKRTFKSIPKNDPPCPNKSCAEVTELAALRVQVANLEKMFAEQRAPGHIGESKIVKAIDTTAQIVMEDHKLTNLTDNVREGETMAPKLAPEMQKAADNFFGGGGGGPRGGVPPQFQNLGAQAINGDFRHTALAPNAVLPKKKPQFVETANPLYGKRH